MGRWAHAPLKEGSIPRSNHKVIKGVDIPMTLLYKMVIIKSAKLLMLGMLMFPVAFASLSVGILFASYNIAVSANPDESDSIYSQTLIFFALIETFVFIALGIAVAAVILFG